MELQQRTFDTMSAGDSRPIPRGDAGVRMSLDWLFTSLWAVDLSGYFSGSWVDWADPLYDTAGKVEDAAWGARLGLDRIVGVGAGGSFFAGAGVEYGEARSWLRTLEPQFISTTGHNIHDEGPRCYMTGGYARLGAMTPMRWRTALCAQTSLSFYGAHASDPPFGTRYDWLGRSLTASVGLRYALARGRAGEP